MITCEVINYWVVDSDGLNVQSVYLKFFPVALANSERIQVIDTTMQPQQNIPTNPNLIISGVVTGPLTFAAIQSDPNYEVLWYE